MKTVEYRGNRYRVSSWAKFIATDADGAVYCFFTKPWQADAEWMSSQIDGAELVTVPRPDWRDSLVELPE